MLALPACDHRRREPDSSAPGDRATDPTAAELVAAEAAMRAQGKTESLAAMEGSPYVPALPTFLKVRPLTDPAGTFAEAVEVFRMCRAK